MTAFCLADYTVTLFLLIISAFFVRIPVWTVAVLGYVVIRLVGIPKLALLSCVN